MTNTSEYMTIKQAQDIEYSSGVFWELHPDVTVEAYMYDEQGYVLRIWELDSNAAITDLESITDGSYRLYGNQYGETFKSLEANIDGDTLIRLIDAR